MNIRLKGKLQSHEVRGGKKPFYYDLPPTGELTVICGCGKRDCRRHVEHGKKWVCTWSVKSECEEVASSIEKQVEFWQYMNMIVEHTLPFMEYKCEVLKKSDMAKNIRNNLRMWQVIRGDIQQQISLTTV